MISNYIFYLYTLSNEEKIKELFILFIFFIVFFGICLFLNSFELKFKDSDKKSKTR